MAVYVNTNVSSLSGQRYLTNATNSLTTTYQRLSSGLRINSAKDDAAGLQISDRLTSQINGLNQGNRNANDGIAFAQTAEGAMDEITNMMQKIRTLAVQANNGTNTAQDKAAIGKEMESLTAEIGRIAQKTTYGGATILDGKGTGTLYTAGANSAGQIVFQVGANSGDTISLDVANMRFSQIVAKADYDKIVKAGNTSDGSTVAIQEAGKEVKFALSAAKADAIGALINGMDAMIAAVDSSRANLGAMQNRLESSIRNQSNTSANEADARSRIRDADFAEESANLSQQSIIQQAATSMLMQANTRPQLGLSLLG